MLKCLLIFSIPSIYHVILYYLIKQECIKPHQEKYVLCDLSSYPMGGKRIPLPDPLQGSFPVSVNLICWHLSVAELLTDMWGSPLPAL